MADQTIEQILSGPDYFTCDQWQARIRKSVCIKRQDLAAKERRSWQDREISGLYLSRCLDCPQGAEIRGALMDQQTEILCKDCKKRPAILRKGGAVANGLCTECFTEKREKTRRANKENKKHAPKKSDDNYVIIRFEDWPGMLENIRRIAKANFRTIENQVLFFVSKGIADGELDLSSENADNRI